MPTVLEGQIDGYYMKSELLMAVNVHGMTPYILGDHNCCRWREWDTVICC